MDTAMMDTGQIIAVSGLRKRFGTFLALDGLDLSVRRGEVAGFLGPNGSGKSTTIRILLGLYRHDGGTAAVFGSDPLADAVSIHRRLAYVPGDTSLWPQLTGGECIDMLVALRGVRAESAGRKAELIERFELDPTKKASTYSKGNRQKVALIAALCAETELLILDEPTSGLDPLMTNEFGRCVREAAAAGTAVLMSSHILSEVEELCDSATIIRAGKTVRSGTLAELRHLRRSRVTMTVAGSLGDLAATEGFHDVEVDGSTATFTIDDTAMGTLTRVLADQEVQHLTVEPPSLEELFLHAYADDETALSTAEGGSR